MARTLTELGIGEPKVVYGVDVRDMMGLVFNYEEAVGGKGGRIRCVR